MLPHPLRDVRVSVRVRNLLSLIYGSFSLHSVNFFELDVLCVIATVENGLDGVFVGSYVRYYVRCCFYLD